MPCGADLINAVASVLTDEPSPPGIIRSRLVATYSSRAVRYALTALLEQGKATRRRSRERTYLYVAAKPVNIV